MNFITWLTQAQTWYLNFTKEKLFSPQGGSNSRPLVYKTSALPLSYGGFTHFPAVLTLLNPNCNQIASIHAKIEVKMK